eukprot:gene8076-13992_t
MADSPKPKRKRGKKQTQVDVEARLQRSRQSARECRARKKMRYKSLEDMIANKEAENLKLRKELEDCLELCKAAKSGEKLSKKTAKQLKEDLEISEDTEPSENEE